MPGDKPGTITRDNTMTKQPEGMVRGLPNCGIVALAAALDLPYPQVFNEFREWFGRQDNWRGRTRNVERENYLMFHGQRYVKLIKPNMSVKRWAYEISISHVKYIVTTGQHVMFLHRMVLVDQYQCDNVLTHKHNKLRIDNILAFKS